MKPEQRNPLPDSEIFDELFRLLGNSGASLWIWDLQTDRISRFITSGNPLWTPGKTISAKEELYRQIHPEDREKVIQAQHPCLSGEKETDSARFRITGENGDIFTVEQEFRISKRDLQGKPLALCGITRVLSPEDKSAVPFCEKEQERCHSIGRSVRVLSLQILEAMRNGSALTVPELLQLLGGGAGADSASLWKNRSDGGLGLTGRETDRWDRESSKNGQYRKNDIYYRNDLPQWHHTESLPETLPILFPPASGEKEGLFRHHDNTLLPILSRNTFWGFLHIAGKKKEEPYSPTELALLHTGAVMLAMAAVQNENREFLLRSGEAAQSGERAKTELLSRMSHEMRTPMNAIVGLSHLAGKSDEIASVRAHLEKINESSRQLAGIIDNLLDMSLLNTDRLEIIEKEFDFEQMLKDLVDAAELKAQEKSQRLLVLPGPLLRRYVIGDGMRLSQILNNLLDNAIKYTPEGGSVGLRIKETLPGDEKFRLRFEISDTGIGISPEALPKIFRSFEQEERTHSIHYGGAGLGLAVSSEIVRLMGGRIEAESEVGKGTVFSFELDFRQGGTLVRDREYALPEDLRVLVTGDMLDTPWSLTETLRYFTANIETADSRMAFEKIENAANAGKPYDIIFADWLMAGFGEKKITWDMAEAAGEGAAVIIAGYGGIAGDEEHRQETSRHYLKKPFMPSALSGLLHRIGRNRAEEKGGEEEPLHREIHMLVVDDIEINREIIMGILEETGVAIDCAEDGRQAVEMFTANPEKYDMIFMDIKMPRMNGIEATRLIRSSGLPGSKTVRIVAMTANNMEDEMRAYFDAGMNGYIGKPIDISQVFGILDQISG